MNAASVALLVAALLQPMLAGGFDLLETVFAGFGFVVLQYALHYVLDRLED